MRKNIRILPLILGGFLLFGCADHLTEGAVKLVYSNLNASAMYSLSEIGVTIDDLPESINVYDTNDIVVTGTVIDPKGNEYDVPMFYFQDYQRRLSGSNEVLTAVGEGQFRMRYTPTVSGKHRLCVTVAYNGEISKYPSNGSYLEFDVAPATSDGFLSVSSDKTRLEYDNGAPYVGRGNNYCGWEWAGSDNMEGTFGYERWLTSLAKDGGNMAQFDLCEGDQLEWTKMDGELEWSDDYDGLLHYNQKAAWKNDFRVSLADELGLFYRLTLLHWEDFDNDKDSYPDWGWGRNPYNTANGGYVADVSSYFKDSKCKEATKNFIRYCVARWGYSPKLMMWELFNEVDAPDMTWGTGKSYQTALADITQWHKEMGEYIKEIDPYKHLITTSCAQLSFGNEFWNLECIDVTTMHNYTMYNDENTPYQYEVVRKISQVVSGRLGSTRKPVLFGEFALSPGGSTQRNYDPEGIAFHNGLYSAIFAGSYGTTMHWTWGSYIDEYDLYYHYKGVEALFKGADLRDMASFNNVNTEQTDNNVWYLGLKGSDSAYLWVKDSMYDWNRTNAGYEVHAMASGSVVIPGMDAGTYYIEKVDTYTGKTSLHGTVNVGSDKRLILNYPSFSKDVAFKVIAEKEYYLSEDMIGNDMPMSYTLQNGRMLTVYAGGITIGGLSDSGRFAYLPVSGDFTYTVRIDKANFGASSAKAGLMVRDSLIAGSKMDFIGYGAYGDYLSIVRTDSGLLATQEKFEGEHPIGAYLRINRTGNRFTSYVSFDGVEFQKAKEIELNFASECLVGVMAANGNQYGYAKAIFNDVSLIRD